jgi:hypothetical protein
MVAHPRILSYDTAPARAREITIDESPDGFTLTIPPWPAWPYYLFASLFAGLFIFQAVMVIRMALFLRAFGAPWPLEPLVFGVFVSETSFWLFVSVFGLVRYRRWGHVPKQFDVRGGTLTLTCQRSFWGITCRRWPLNDIDDVRWKPLKSLIPRHAAADLLIGIPSLFPLRLRFSGRNVPIAERFAILLRQAVAQAR